MNCIIITRTMDYNNESKFHKAGADYIISPNKIAANRITNIISKKNIFEYLNIDVNIFISNKAKDAAEHFFEKKLSLNDLILKNDITKEEIMNKEIQDFNFTKYLKNRKF